MSTTSRICAALKAFFIHFSLSIAIAVVAAALVFGVWFPYPYRELAGGQYLFFLMMVIDVVCGPLLTAIIFNPKKPRRELKMDIAVVVILQLVVLGYGLYSISLARPVRLAFEADRFVSVAAADIDSETLKDALPGLDTLPWSGPELVGTRAAKDGDEVLQSVNLSAQGLEPSARPGWWQDFNLNKDQVRNRMRALPELMQKLPVEKQATLNASINESRLKIEELHYLPLVSKKSLDEWIVLLDGDANIVGYAAVDGFQ